MWCSPFELATCEPTVLSPCQDYTSLHNAQFKQQFDELLSQFDQLHQWVILRAHASHLSGWLTAVPTAQDHFDLTAQEFRDALAVHYKKPLLGLPPSCDGCGTLFSLAHALICRKEGLIIQRHNKIHDVVGDLATLVWKHVCYSAEYDALVADLGICATS